MNTPVITRKGHSVRLVGSESGPRPQFTHDCDCCQYLGQLDGQGRDDTDYDVYYCEREDTVILRYSDEGGDYKSMPLPVVKIMPTNAGDWGPAGEIARQWEAAGRPELPLMQRGQAFFDEFTVAARYGQDEDASGETGTSVTLVGVTHRVKPEDVEHYISVRHPVTRCQHSHDCCGNIYTQSVKWSWVPGTNERLFKVEARWAQNI